MCAGFKALIAILIFSSFFSLGGSALWAQQPCPARPVPGSVVKNPYVVRSQNGALSVDFTLKNSIDQNGFLHDCVNYQTLKGIVEAPTLHVRPGDQLIMNLTNALVENPQQQAKTRMKMRSMTGTQANDPCNGMDMSSVTTNVHFHGLNVPPICHQDDVIHTAINPGDPAFQYKITIPKNEPPGLYWYHPHPHGFTTVQVSGGAAGALIVGGIEKVKTEVAGLPQRVFVIRQQFLNPGSWLPGPNQLTINYQPAITPFGLPPIIKMKPGAKEFWRLANATTVTFLNLQIVSGSTPQKLHVVAFDGVPVTNDTDLTTLLVPPAGRVEFTMEGPASGSAMVFQTLGTDTGAAGDPNPPQILASLLPDKNADVPETVPAVATQRGPTQPMRFAGLAAQPLTTKRKLYFSEATAGSNGPTQFFITVDGQRPRLFRVEDPPAIVTHVGAVEEWTIENRSPEVHAFHMHQIHFLVTEINSKPVDPELRDTITIPYWKGKGSFPKVKVIMDFRDPEIAGTFVYHCHILDHEDAGMMAKIEVDPAQ
jgi:FtsP/CotA-like multicopper oxidase with cupredoxin domain